MNEAMLISQKGVAELFGVYRNTIGDLVKKHKIQPKPMSNGKAKGLDRRDIKRIARSLGVTVDFKTMTVVALAA